MPEIVGRTVVCYSRGELEVVWSERRVTVDQGPFPAGWYTLAVLERCPGRCEGGVQLQGGDLVDCLTCGGDGTVAVGVGGVSVNTSTRRAYEIDGESFHEWSAATWHVLRSRVDA